MTNLSLPPVGFRCGGGKDFQPRLPLVPRVLFNVIMLQEHRVLRLFQRGIQSICQRNGAMFSACAANADNQVALALLDIMRD